MNQELWSHSCNEIFKEYETSLNGIDSKTILNRKKMYGLNELPKARKKTIFMTFFEQLLNPMCIVLIVTIILSFIIGEYLDAMFIIFVLLLDSILGTFQEWKAEKSAESLANLICSKSRVIRDGVQKIIDSNDLVIGDIVVLESGDKVSADLRLIKTNNLLIDESVLTGESLPKEKNDIILNKNIVLTERNNMAYVSTNVTSGRAIGVVVGVGENTEVGKIASNILKTPNTKSPLTIRMEKFTKQISVIILIIALIIMIGLWFKGYELKMIFVTVIALSISAIPEGLPASLTLVLSIASNKMAKKNVIVKKLNSVESLGSCTVLATDKTGTLTINKQTAKVLKLPNGMEYEVTGAGYNDDGSVLCFNEDMENIKKIAIQGVINNESYLVKKNHIWNSYGDSIDIAFLSLGYKLGINVQEEEKNILQKIPYESVNKCSTVYYTHENNVYCSVKGSIEIILEHCDTMLIGPKKVKLNKKNVLNYNDELAKKGYRIIAFAVGLVENYDKNKEYSISDIKKLSFVGMVGFIDPIREESKEAILKCNSAGIKVSMITGDHPLTAYAIARELNLVSNFKEVASSEDIDKHYNMGLDHFDKFVANIKVFTRTTPLQKLNIVESYKRQGEFVAVTGDGVNDAPALKSANIGIAMGSGTDVAKETSSMIVTDDNFLSIVMGIEEGRIAYNNIKKVIYLLMSCAISEILFISLSIAFNYPLPLVAVQLLWLNLVTDGIQDVALSFERDNDAVMKQKPNNPNENLFCKSLFMETLISGISIGLIVFIFFEYLLNTKHVDINYARGYILLLMVIIQNIHVFNCRSERKSIFKTPVNNNPFLIISIITIIFLQIIVTESSTLSNLLLVPSLTLKEILIAVGLSLIVILVMEIYKFIMGKYYKKRRNKVNNKGYVTNLSLMVVGTVLLSILSIMLGILILGK